MTWTFRISIIYTTLSHMTIVSYAILFTPMVLAFHNEIPDSIGNTVVLICNNQAIMSIT